MFIKFISILLFPMFSQIVYAEQCKGLFRGGNRQQVLTEKLRELKASRRKTIKRVELLQETVDVLEASRDQDFALNMWILLKEEFDVYFNYIKKKYRQNEEGFQDKYLVLQTKTGQLTDVEYIKVMRALSLNERIYDLFLDISLADKESMVKMFTRDALVNIEGAINYQYKLQIESESIHSLYSLKEPQNPNLDFEQRLKVGYERIAGKSILFLNHISEIIQLYEHGREQSTESEFLRDMIYNFISEMKNHGEYLKTKYGAPVNREDVSYIELVKTFNVIFPERILTEESKELIDSLVIH